MKTLLEVLQAGTDYLARQGCDEARATMQHLLAHDTAWPSILPTQAESWIGEQRVVLRRAGVELFPKFTVTNIEAGGVLEATLDAVSGESYTDVAGHARATGPVRVPGVIVTARDEEQGVEVEWQDRKSVV